MSPILALPNCVVVLDSLPRRMRSKIAGSSSAGRRNQERDRLADRLFRRVAE